MNRVVCGSLCALLASGSHAIDSNPGVTFPGLVSDANGTVTLLSSSVALLGAAVTVNWSLSAGDDAAALMVETPAFTSMGSADPYPDRHFPELAVRIDGQPILPQEWFDAFIGKFNVTNLVKAARMDPWAIAKIPPITSPRPDNPQILTGLVNSGAIVKSGADLSAQSPDEYLARWTARRILRIPLTTSHPQLEFVYKARPAFSELLSEQLFTASREILYCADAKPLAALRRVAPRAEHWNLDEYTISVGINGAPPTKVTLAIADPSDSRTARTVTFACGARGAGFAVTGNFAARPVRVDANGDLHLLRVREAISPPAQARSGSIRPSP